MERRLRRLKAPTAAQHILIASPTSARKDFDPQTKLILIYRPRKDERLSWPARYYSNIKLKQIHMHASQ